MGLIIIIKKVLILCSLRKIVLHFCLVTVILELLHFFYPKLKVLQLLVEVNAVFSVPSCLFYSFIFLFGSVVYFGCVLLPKCSYFPPYMKLYIL